jgi:capsular exopolysaccharide synthesis family protein
LPRGERFAKPIAQTNPKSPITEAYRTIRTNVQFASVISDAKTILVTSSVPGEGKTSTAANLAVVSAQTGKKVILVDTDLRKPQIHLRFQVSNLYGLSSVLIKERSLEECILPSETPGLDLLPSGAVPPNPYEILASKPFTELMERLESEYDMVLLDTPPVLSVADALVLTRSAEGSCICGGCSKDKPKTRQKSAGGGPTSGGQGLWSGAEQGGIQEDRQLLLQLL